MAGDKANRTPGTLARIKEFEKNVEALEDDLIVEKKKTAALKKVNAKLEKYRALDPQNKELKKKNFALEKELKRLEKSKDSQDDYMELKQECVALQKDVKRLEKIRGLEDEHQVLKQNYAALDKEFKKLDNSKHSGEEYNDLEKNCSALEKDIKKLTVEHEDLKPKFIGAKTALQSIKEEKNQLKVEVMTLSTRLTATNTENDELKIRNASLMLENEKIKYDAARCRHENICMWKEDTSSKARIAELQRDVEQQTSRTAEIAGLKQCILERGETIKMNMLRIAELEQTIQDRERAITALQAGQNAMATTEIERTLQIHRLTEQIAIDQDHNKYLYDKLATEMHAYHANVYHLRMGGNTEVPFPNSGGGYLCPPSSQYLRDYDMDVDRTGHAYRDQEGRERDETPDELIRREAGEHYRSETDTGLQRHEELGRQPLDQFIWA